MAVNDDDNELFRQQLGEIKPLKKSNKAQLDKLPQVSQKTVEQRRQAAQAANSAGTENLAAGATFVSDDYVDMLEPGALLEFKNPGVQDGVYRKFRLGKYPIDGRLDLHRRTVAQARVEVFDFVREALVRDARTVLILHGKGERNVERPGVLKSYVAKWLKEMPEVLAYHTAQQRHGGLGAAYVLLRKSEKMKERTREEHAGKRG